MKTYSWFEQHRAAENRAAARLIVAGFIMLTACVALASLVASMVK